MKVQKLFLTLLSTPLIMMAYAQVPLDFQIDEAATADAPWEIGEVVTSGGISLDFVEYMVDRVFLGKTRDGFYVVQDMYQPESLQKGSADKVKYSDPYVILTLESAGELRYPKIHGGRVLYDVDGSVLESCQFNYGATVVPCTQKYVTGELKEEYTIEMSYKKYVLDWSLYFPNGRKNMQSIYCELYQPQQTVIKTVVREWDESGELVAEAEEDDVKGPSAVAP